MFSNNFQEHKFTIKLLSYKISRLLFLIKPITAVQHPYILMEMPALFPENWTLLKILYNFFS
jgi:hypothetical protein